MRTYIVSRDTVINMFYPTWSVLTEDRTGMLGRLRRSLTIGSAIIVYCSLIRPILECCVSVWGCCGEGHKHGLEALQNRAARIVARTVRSNPAMDLLKWPTLEERRRKTVFKLVKKCLQG